MAKLFATTNPAVSEREITNGNRARKIAVQGMVLLENDGTLPLTKGGKIALYGNGARRTIGGGTGSGSVNSREVVNVGKGLEAAGFEVITKDWIDRDCANVEEKLNAYNANLMKNLQERGMAAIMDLFSHPFIEPAMVPVESKDIHAAETDTAIFVIARNSGEGADRHVAPGEYELCEEEIDALKKLTASYSKVVVVLNVGNVVDVKPLKKISGINAILLMSQAGNYGGYAVTDILCGDEVPSGRLTTTWGINYNDYPCAATFSHCNGDIDDEFYNEGIYVGYRYFDTFNVTPQYPFGYGLGYTTFEVSTEEVSADETEVTVKASVKNTGSFRGREVVQVYISAPDGVLEKPYQELKGYAKTAELTPGESETLTVTFPTASLASYDEKRAAYVLEAGDYYVRVGVHSRATHIAAKLTLEKEVITEQLENKLVPDTDLSLLSRKGVAPYSYEGEEAEKASAKAVALDASKFVTKTASYSPVPAALPKTDKDWKITFSDVRSGKATLDELVSQLTPEEMATLAVGSARNGLGGPQIGNSSAACPGAAGDTTSLLIDDRGIRNLILADGPAGLRLTQSFKTDADNNMLPGSTGLEALDALMGLDKQEVPADAKTYYQYTTAIPIATLLAQTWDVAAIEDAGDIVGGEMEELGVDLWLAPGMNIHRNPLCGRNFEYYSEDPLISGRSAAADTKGVQKHKSAGTTIKHFAFNNQEDNRNHVNSHVSERASREIFLKGFEIAVKESQPKSIMSSYNLVNGEHTANSHDLLTALARDEWGFEGFVMTDWGTTGSMNELDPSGSAGEFHKYGNSFASGCVKAGNDLTMPGSQGDIDDILNALDKKDGEVPYPLTLGELQDAAKHILQVILTMER